LHQNRSTAFAETEEDRGPKEKGKIPTDREADFCVEKRQSISMLINLPGVLVVLSSGGN
jgi:hypothetical protein